jgi:CrcB protein
MIAVVLVAVGGGLGAGVRWLATELIPSTDGFPTAITIVNVLGSLALGVIVGAELAASSSVDVGPLTVGILAGFTTFSTWMVDIETAESGTRAALVAVVPLVVGLATAAIGLAIGAALT